MSSLASYYLQNKNMNSTCLNVSKLQKQNALKNVIKTFLEKDENSAMAPGKKDIIKKKWKDI